MNAIKFLALAVFLSIDVESAITGKAGEEYKAVRYVRDTRGRPETLASTLGNMQQNTAQGIQYIGAGNFAEAGGSLTVEAVGGNVVFGSSGGSDVEGYGTITAAGTTTVTSSGESATIGRKTGGESQTYQGISAGNSAHAGDYLDAVLSGIDVSVANSGSSSTSGAGSVTVSGTTSVINNSGGQGGWKSR